MLKILRNKYTLVLAVFIAWMLFLDSNSWLVHRKLDKEIKNLKDNIEYFESEIARDKAFLEKLQDEEELEKFARKQYRMKREDEDIFIIEDLDSIRKEQ